MGVFSIQSAGPAVGNNNSTYKTIHTQDPSGAGGMDDRHDQLLVCEELIDGDGFDYIGDPGIPYSLSTWDDANHSYRSWGNDGTSYNTSLTIVGNTMVGQTIAQALVTTASGGGHLPVFLDLRVPPHVGSSTLIDFGQVQQGSLAEDTLLAWNAGDVGLWSQDGIAYLDYSLEASTGFTAPAGTFSDAAGGADNNHIIEMDTSTVGVKNGTLMIFSNAPDEPGREVILTGEVVSGTLGDLNCDGTVNSLDIDPFVLAMASAPGFGDYYVAYPACDPMLADCNSDGSVNSLDVDPFVELMN